jgi:cytochrome c oxidase subunit 4
MSHHSDQVHHHIVPDKTNFFVFLSLVCCTVITVLIAGVDFGSFNLLVAMTVALIKASIVAWWFMHLKYDTVVNRFVFISAFIMLFIMIFIVFLDQIERIDLFLPLK